VSRLCMRAGESDEAMLELQNGSDIRGYAVASPGGKPVTLTDDRLWRIGFGFAALIKERFEAKHPDGASKKVFTVAVGRDSRISGERVSNAFVDGLTAAGCNVVQVGLATTPAMFKSTCLPGFGTDAGVMITASHLPFDRNGLKFFLPCGGLAKDDISRILEVASSATFEDAKVAPSVGSVTTKDLLSAYAEDLVESIRSGAQQGDRPLEGLRVIVDAGNGCGGFFVDRVLQPLGADTSGSQFLEPDGMFPNHIPNPEDHDAMQSARHATLESKADLGIIFDTDVDRAGAVDASGEEINRNRLIALAGAIVLEEHPGTTIVTDSVTSNGLTSFIEGLGGKHHRFKRGYKNVIEEAVRLSEAGEPSFLAMETSGHGAQADNAWLDDGAYTVVKLLIKMSQLRKEGKGLMSMIETLEEPVEMTELRFKLTNKKDFSIDGRKILNALPAYAKNQEDWHVVTPNYEGVRVQIGDTWFLLRMSLHDPIMALNIESEEKGGSVAAAVALEDFLESFSDLVDISPLSQMVDVAHGDEECLIPEDDEAPDGWQCIINALQKDNDDLRRKVAELEAQVGK